MTSTARLLVEVSPVALRRDKVSTVQIIFISGGIKARICFIGY
jgi:hypothetical protein